MAHNDRRRKVWPPTATPTPEELRDLDQLTSESLNGDDGGSWAPLTPVIVGGAGGTVYGAGGFQGEVRTGERKLTGGALVLGNADYPVSVPPLARSFVMSLRDFASRRDVLSFSDNVGIGIFATLSDPNWPHDDSIPGYVGNIGSYAPVGLVAGPEVRPTRLVMPIPSKYLVHGATVTDFHLTWRASFSWKPIVGSSADTWGLPGFRITRLQNGVYANAASELIVTPRWQQAVVIHYNPGDVLLPDTGSTGHRYRVIVGGLVGPASLVPPWSSHTTNGEIWTDFFSGMQYQTQPLANPFAATALWGQTAAAGTPQVIQLPANCLNASAATIDLVNYSYFLEVYDPSALHKIAVAPATADMFYHSLKISLSNVGIRPVY